MLNIFFWFWKKMIWKYICSKMNVKLKSHIIDLKFSFGAFGQPSLDRFNTCDVVNNFFQVGVFFGQVKSSHEVQIVQDAN